MAVVVCGALTSSVGVSSGQEAAKEQAPAGLIESKPQGAPRSSLTNSESTCLLIEAAARDHGLPLEFFARVIWQESRFRPEAVGPVTRSGQRAQGIAQFMPPTAAERSLLDPFDPVQALPKSAEFLHQLYEEFGNLGLAAAAYNAGPRRVREWLAGTGPMPAETRAYVAAITGAPVEAWVSVRGSGPVSQHPKPGCRELTALLTRAPTAFVNQREPGTKPVALQPPVGSMSKRVRAMIVDRSLVIGQAMACGLANDRVDRARALHAANVEQMTNNDRQAGKLLDNMIRLGKADEQKLGQQRCGVIAAALAGLEKLLRGAVKTASRSGP